MKRKVCIDAQNVGHENGMISGLRIEDAFNAMEKYGFEAHAILPSHLITGENGRKRTIVKHPEIIKKLVSEKRLSLVSNNDDEAIITTAYDNDGFILTNDRYRDHKDKKWCTPRIKKIFEYNLITFDFIEEKFTIPLSERKRLNIRSENSLIPHISIPDFKAHATNGGVPKDIPFDALPEQVRIIPELISQNSGEITLAALGSQLKNATGCKLKDLFGNAKHATRFLESRGYPIRHDKSNTYVKGVAA